MTKDNRKNLILWPLLTITIFMTDIQTDRHGDSMTDPAQRAEWVKIYAKFYAVLVRKNVFGLLHVLFEVHFCKYFEILTILLKFLVNYQKLGISVGN